MPQSPSPRPAWLGFAEFRPTPRGTYRFRLRWGRICALFGTLTVIGYFAAAGGVYLLYKERKGFSELALTDVLLWRRESLRLKQGEADISRGLEALQQGAGREAFNYLRTGVARAPAHLDGRLALIRLYAGGFPHLAEDLFEKGRAYHATNPLFLETYAAFLFHRRMDREVLDLVDEVLRDQLPESDSGRLIARFGMQSAIRLGRFSTASDLYHRYDLGNTPEGVLGAVEALERLDEPDEALKLLQHALRQPHLRDQLPLHVRLIHLHLDRDDVAAATDAAFDLALMAPLEWQPRLLLIDAFQAAGRETEVAREAAALLGQFRESPAAIAALAQFAQRHGRVDLARDTYFIALEKDFEVYRFNLLFVETHLTAGRFAEALALCDEIEAEAPAWLNQHLPAFHAIRSIASYRVGNVQRGALYQRAFIREARGRTRVLQAVAQSFLRADLPSIAYEILESAVASDPQDERALADLLALQIELGNSRALFERVERLLGLRRPSYAIFEQVRAELASDRFLFAEQRHVVEAALSRVLEERITAGAAFQLPAL